MSLHGTKQPIISCYILIVVGPVLYLVLLCITAHGFHDYVLTVPTLLHKAQ
jgi:hypothetical protein